MHMVIQTSIGIYFDSMGSYIYNNDVHKLVNIQRRAVRCMVLKDIAIQPLQCSNIFPSLNFKLDIKYLYRLATCRRFTKHFTTKFLHIFLPVIFQWRWMGEKSDNIISYSQQHPQHLTKEAFSSEQYKNRTPAIQKSFNQLELTSWAFQFITKRFMLTGKWETAGSTSAGAVWSMH